MVLDPKKTLLSIDGIGASTTLIGSRPSTRIGVIGFFLSETTDKIPSACRRFLRTGSARGSLE